MTEDDRLIPSSCLIVKTDGYNRDQIGKVVQLRSNIEGLKLGAGVLERIAEEGERGSMRYDIFQLTVDRLMTASAGMHSSFSLQLQSLLVLLEEVR